MVVHLESLTTRFGFVESTRRIPSASRGFAMPPSAQKAWVGAASTTSVVGSSTLPTLELRRSGASRIQTGPWRTDRYRERGHRDDEPDEDDRCHSGRCSTAREPTIDVDHVAPAVVYVATLPLDANVRFMTVIATKMPYVGRG
jgi:hypothetical protein